MIKADFSRVIPKLPSTHKEMLSVSVNGGKTTVRINSSSLDLMMQCWRKTEYDLIEQWKPKHGAAATVFGTAIHAALEEFYSTKREGRELPPDYKKNLELMAYGQQLPFEQDYLIYKATRKFIEAAAPLADLPAADMRSISNGVWILTQYYETWIKDPYTIYHCPEGLPFVERRLEAPLFTSAALDIHFFGTIDLILQSEATGEILVTDHKTFSSNANDFFNRLKPNHQYSAYVWLVQQCLGIDTDKFMINGVQVKAKPKTARGTPPSFPRQITTRDEYDLEDFRRTVKTFVTQFLHNQQEDYFPMGSVNSCTMYRKCKYLEVCSSPLSLRKNILEASYERAR